MVLLLTLHKNSFISVNATFHVHCGEQKQLLKMNTLTADIMKYCYCYAFGPRFFFYYFEGLFLLFHEL